MNTCKQLLSASTVRWLIFVPLIVLITIALTSCKGKNKPLANSTEEVSPPPSPPPAAPVENADLMPQFPGGTDALRDYILKNVKYPENAKSKGIQGVVYVSFVVMTDGKVSDVKVTKGVEESLDAEASRVVNSLPAFEKPGIKNGSAVPVRMALPIYFALK